MSDEPISRPTLKELVDSGRLEPLKADPKIVPIPKRMCRPLPNERTGEILIFTGVTRVYTDVEPPCDV